MEAPTHFLKSGTIPILGLDIGGTKTAAVLGTLEGEIWARVEMPTPADAPFEAAFEALAQLAADLLDQASREGLPLAQAVSVAVGGPLDIEAGVIFSPPHLPTWERAPLKERLEQRFRLPVFVEHDGNAGALAELYFGAGRGAQHLVYLTLGTGLGAGIILNGQVVHGATDAAGEVGHIRLAPDGPREYGKAGSWEGLSSGAGLIQLARLRFPHRWGPQTPTYEIVQAAQQGDRDALQVVEEAGQWLGRGLAILVDTLNPEVIVVGTLGRLLGDLLLEPARRELEREALPVTARACRLLPAALGENLSSVSALMAAIHAYHQHPWASLVSPEAALALEALESGLQVRQRLLRETLPVILQAGRMILDVLHAGGMILIFGNGGSAASAQHFAGELIGHYQTNRLPLKGIALTADSSVVTCIANDYSFDQLFARQVQALAGPQDLAIGLTTSGRSRNVLNALRLAAEQGAHTLALTGETGLAEPVAELVVSVPSSETARIQEEHDAIIHVWCDLIETAFPGE